MTTKIKATTMSGWCISGVHKGKDSCESFYLKQSYNRGCTCSCHPKVDKEVTDEVESQDEQQDLPVG